MSPQNFFENYGYWIESEPLFSSQDLAEYRQSMNDIMNHQYESGREPMALPRQAPPSVTLSPRRLEQMARAVAQA